MQTLENFKKEFRAACAKNLDHAKLELSSIIKLSKRQKDAEGEPTSAEKIQVCIEIINDFTSGKALKQNKKAVDLIAEINEAISVDAVDLILGNDTRATVIKAAKDKKEALAKTE